MNKFGLILLCLILTVLTFDGCVPSRPDYEEAKYTSSRLIIKLEANRRKIKTFRGTGVINVNSPQAKANFEIILKKPDSIKVSIFGPLGISLAEIFVTKKNFLFYDTMNNNLYEGDVKNDILKRIFKVDISFDELIDAFAGSVNLSEKLGVEPDKYIVNDEQYVMTYIDSLKNNSTTYNINISDLAITDYAFTDLSGKEFVKGKYTDFKTYEEVPVPYKSILENRKGNQKLEISYRSMEINKFKGKLEINLPSGINRIKL